MSPAGREFWPPGDRYGCREARCRRIPCRRRLTVIFGEPETARFLAVVQRIKRLHRVKLKRTRLAKQKARAVLRKMREC